MKFFLLMAPVILTAACSNQAVYNMVHEKQRQDCLKQGRTDCPPAESYDKYKQTRDEIMKSE